VVLATLGVTAVVAVLAGGLYGLLRPSAGTVTTSPTVSTTVSPTPRASATTPAPATSASRTASATPTPTPRQTAYVADPTTVTGMDFGVLRGIARTGTGTVLLRVDRAAFLTGAKAQAYYTAHPKLEPLDYAVVNTNPRVRTFQVTDDAVVYAQYALGDHNAVKAQPITVDQLYVRAKALVDSHEIILLWLRHTQDPDGPVYYVAEQYVP
jgi:hypothetical protein